MSQKVILKTKSIKKPQNVELFWLRLIFQRTLQYRLPKEVGVLFKVGYQTILFFSLFFLIYYLVYFKNIQFILNWHLYKHYVNIFFIFEWCLNSRVFLLYLPFKNEIQDFLSINSKKDSINIQPYFLLNRCLFLRGPLILDVISIERGRSFWHIYLHDYGLLLESNWIQKIYNRSSTYGWIGWHYDSNTEVNETTTLGRGAFQATFFAKKWPKNPTLTHRISYRTEESKKFAHQLNRFYASYLENLRLFRRERGLFRVGTIANKEFITFKPLYRRIMQQYVQRFTNFTKNGYTKLIRQPFLVKLKVRNLTRQMDKFHPLIICLNLTSKVITRWNTTPIFKNKHLSATKLYAPDMKFLRRRAEYEIKSKTNTPEKRKIWYSLAAEASKKRFYEKYIEQKTRVWVDLYRTLILHKHNYQEIWPMKYAAFSYVSTPIVYNLADNENSKDNDTQTTLKNAKGVFYKEQINLLNEVFDMHSFRFRFYIPFQHINSHVFKHKWFTSRILLDRTRAAAEELAANCYTRSVKQNTKYYKNTSIFQSLGSFLMPKRKTFLDTLYWFQYYLVPRQVLINYYRLAYASRRRQKKYKQVWNVFSKYKQRMRFQRVLELRKSNYNKLDYLRFNKYATFPDWMRAWYFENKKARSLLKKKRHEILKAVNRLLKKPTRDEPTVDINTKRGFSTVGERSFFRWNTFYHNFIRYSQLWHPRNDFGVFFRTKNTNLKIYVPEPFLLLKPYKQAFTHFRDKLRFCYKPILMQLRYASPHYTQRLFDLVEKDFQVNINNNNCESNDFAVYDFFLKHDINFLLEWKRKILIKKKYKVTYAPHCFHILWSFWMFLMWSRILAEGEGNTTGHRAVNALLPNYIAFYSSAPNKNNTLGVLYKVHKYLDGLSVFLNLRGPRVFWRDNKEPIWFQDARPLIAYSFRMGNSRLLANFFNFNLYKFAGKQVGSYFNLFFTWFPYKRLVNFWSLPFDEQTRYKNRKRIISKEMWNEFLEYEIKRTTRRRSSHRAVFYNYGKVYKLGKGRFHQKRKLWSIRVGDILGHYGTDVLLGTCTKIQSPLILYLQTILRGILYTKMCSKIFNFSFLDLQMQNKSNSFSNFHQAIKTKVNVSSLFTYLFFYNKDHIKWLTPLSGISFFGGSFENVLNRGNSVEKLRLDALSSAYLHVPYLHVKSRYAFVLLMNIPKELVIQYNIALKKLHEKKIAFFFTTYKGGAPSIDLNFPASASYLIPFTKIEYKDRTKLFANLQFYYFNCFLKNSVELFLLYKNKRGIKKRFLFDCNFDNLYFCLTHQRNLLLFNQDTLFGSSSYHKLKIYPNIDTFRYNILTYNNILEQGYLPFKSNALFSKFCNKAKFNNVFYSMSFWYNVSFWSKMFTAKALLKTTDNYLKYNNSFYYFLYPYIRKIRSNYNQNLSKNYPKLIGYNYILQTFQFAMKRNIIIEEDYTPVFPVRSRKFRGWRGFLENLMIPWPFGYFGLLLTLTAGTGIPAMRRNYNYFPKVLQNAYFRLPPYVISALSYRYNINAKNIVLIFKKDKRHFMHKFLLIQFFKFKKLFENCISTSTTRFEVEISGGKCFRHWYVGRILTPRQPFSIFPSGDLLLPYLKQIIHFFTPKSKIFRYSLPKGLKRREMYLNLIYNLADYTTYKYNEPGQIKFFYDMCFAISRNLRSTAPLIQIFTANSSIFKGLSNVSTGMFGIKLLQSFFLVSYNVDDTFDNVFEGDGFFFRSTRFYFRRFMGAKLGLDFTNFYEYSERALFMAYLQGNFKKQGSAPAYT